MAGRLVSDENLDLYVLVMAAVTVALLGAVGVAGITALASVILALLAALAFSQIRSRRYVAEIANVQRRDPFSVFRGEFPEDLARRRAAASSVLLIGLSLHRAVHAGSLVELRRMLLSGARVRMLVLDPADEALVRAASCHVPAGAPPGRLGSRIRSTLDELAELRSSTGGDLEIRVASFVPSAGFNVIDEGRADGVIVVQHYEHRPRIESAPIITVTPADGAWYEHFAAEAHRMWDDGRPWPLSGAQQLGRSSRPQFQDAFGQDLLAAMSQARELMITGIARSGLLSRNYSSFEEWLNAGRPIRVVLMDPACEAITAAADRYYAGRSPDMLRERVRHTLSLLNELNRCAQSALSVRLTSHPLAMGVVALDAAVPAETSALFVEYYSYRARGEPKFVLQPADDPWFSHFRDEAEALWANADDYTLR